MTLAPSEWRIIKFAFILALVAAALSWLIGCSGAEVRPPDRIGLSLSQGLGDDFHGTGTQASTPPPHGGGASQFSASSDGEAVVGVYGEWDMRPDGRSVMSQLDALQATFLARPEPAPAMVSIPRPDADPALLASLEGLTVAVRRLEEALAAQEALSAPVSDEAADAPEESPEVAPVADAAVGGADQPEEGSAPWAVAQVAAAIAGILAIARYWPEVGGAVAAAYRFITRRA